MSCKDCGLPYEDFGLDTVLPEEFWIPISPQGEGEGNGILCANCIVKRLSKIEHVIAVYAIPMYSEYDENDEPIDLPTHCRELEAKAFRLERELKKLRDKECDD